MPFIHAVGQAESLVFVRLDLNPATGLATLELTGPSDVWFGVGLNASLMADQPYTLVVLGNGTVQEWHLGNHLPGTQLPSSVTVLNNTVAAGQRTVVLTRSLRGSIFSFNMQSPKINLINAIGATAAFGYHTSKATATVFLVETSGATCVCSSTGGQGTIDGVAWGPQKCVAKPLGQMLNDPVRQLARPFVSYRGKREPEEGGNFQSGKKEAVWAG